MDTRIVSIVGRQGAGKSTVGKYLAEIFGVVHIETSYIVRSLFKDILRREELASTGQRTEKDPNWLGRAIEEEIKDEGAVILTGVREKEVHQYLKSQGAQVRIIVLQCPAVERYLRLRNLHKVESPKDFIEQEIREDMLGIKGTMQNAELIIQTNVLDTAEETVERIRKLL